MTAAHPQYRQLDEVRIIETLTRLRDRIGERFPDSGLYRVAVELLALSGEVSGFVQDVRKPHWPIRIAVLLALAGMAVVFAAIVGSVEWSAGVGGVGELVQSVDAGLSTMVFLGATVWFLMNLENRLKRHRALGILHQLRSVAHVVDLHQLTKDPERLGSPEGKTGSSSERQLRGSGLARYLDYCSELLSVISKLAALHAQQFDDSLTLAAVNDVESLTSGLSSKIWQKISLLERSRQSAPGGGGP